MAENSRVTKTIKFNLNDRGWLYNGKDRSNYDVKGMIEKFNSPQVQEQVDSGVLNGFCGHQIRQRYGMIPPESAEIQGRVILLEPASRTVYLKAHANGDVEHKQEFYNNKSGEHVYQQYKAKIGGFSTAMNYFVDGPVLRPNIFGGFDYVFSPNYRENASIGVFDSTQDEGVIQAIYDLLETQIVDAYDSMEQFSQLNEYLSAQSERSRQLEQELNRMKKQRARRIQKETQLNEDKFDSLLFADKLAFDDVFSDAQKFLGASITHENKSKKELEDLEVGAYMRGINGLIGGK